MLPNPIKDQIFSILACCLLLVLLLLPFTVSCSRTEEPKQKTSSVQAPATNKLKVLIVGIDGLVPGLVDKFSKVGMMPNMQKVMSTGAVMNIQARVSMSSPVIWTTIATSTPPETHGITHFTIDGVPANSSFRKVPALWNILDYHDIKSATLGWWATWPAEKDAGIMISSRAYWGNFEEKIYPPNAIDTEKYDITKSLNDLSFLPPFTEYPYNPSYKTNIKKSDPTFLINNLIDDRLVKIYHRDRIFIDIAEELLQKEKPQVMNVYLRGIDYVEHAFWQFMEPEPFQKAGWNIDTNNIESMGNIIPQYYAYIDRLIGRLLPYCDDQTYIYIISDHGFEAGPQLKKEKPELGLSGEHTPSTLFIAQGQDIVITNPPSNARHMDFLPTILYNLGLPVSKEFVGRPLKELFPPSFQKSHPLKYVDNYNTLQKENKKTSSGQDKDILGNLKSLGYIK